MRIHRALRSPSAWLAFSLLASGATAALADYGRPVDWQMGMQDMATNLGQSVSSFHTWVTALMGLVVLFVLGLIVAVVVKFNENANPTPSRTTHHTVLEIAWTVVPVLILVAIAIPSFRILREQMILPQKADVVLKTIGHAWYWEYEYPAAQAGLPPEQGGFKFDQRILSDPNDQAKALPGPNGEPKQLAVDNEAVVPVNKVVLLQVTSADVLHSFGVPSIGFTMDAVPGRLNEIWFKADREGVYYGQCRELCGVYHPFMPIAIRVVSEAQYGSWLAEAKQKFARTGTGTEFAAGGKPAATSVAAAR
jgi:cytochrome c oxidase subunit II